MRHLVNFLLQILLLTVRDRIVMVPAACKRDLEVDLSLLVTLFVGINLRAELSKEIDDVSADLAHLFV